MLFHSFSIFVDSPLNAMTHAWAVVFEFLFCILCLSQALLFSLQLQHIENHLEASPGSGVLLDSVMDTKKSSGGATRKVSHRGEVHNDIAHHCEPWLLFTEQGSQTGLSSRHRHYFVLFCIARLLCRNSNPISPDSDGRRTEDCSQAGGTSKSRRRSHRSPDKSSRSPLRNTTQDSNVHRNNCVEFKEPLTSYRYALLMRCKNILSVFLPCLLMYAEVVRRYSAKGCVFSP